MFIKPFKVKSNTAIRGSDRRKLRSQITNLFPSLSAEQVSELIPNKDDMTVMKLMTHSGDYVTAFILNGDPIFFEVEKQIFPTVYTLWRYPRIVPVFYTWPPVFENIKGGADLMLPGVILPKEGISGLGTFHKGDVCSVALHGNRAPVAVGSTTISSNDLQEHTMRGKGVLLVHSYLDHMWSQGTKTHLPQLDPLPSGEPAPDEDNVCEQFNEHINLCDKEEESNDNQENLVDDQNLENNINKTRTNDENISQNVDELLNKNGDEDVLTQGSNAESAKENKEEGSDKVLEKQTLLGTEDSGNGAEDLEESGETFACMDDLLQYCFFKGILSAKKVELPILTSTFYRNHLLVSCPEGQVLDIKKSRFKKLSKFLQEMMEQSFLKVAEVSKGVDHITDINWQHPELVNFKKSHRDDAVPIPQVTEKSNEERQPPEITELLAISGGAWNSLQPIFKTAGLSKGSVVSPSDVRNVVTAYVRANNLIHEQDKRKIVLDPMLSRAFKVKGQTDVDVLSWDQLFTRVLNMLNHCYQLTLPGYEPVIRKGKIEPIDIKTETRTGNKKATLVKNLEVYGIDPSEFAHKLQVRVAGSTSVSQLPGKKLPAMMQVMIQGNQIQHVGNALLDEYKIPKKYISGLDKVKPSGKKKT